MLIVGVADVLDVKDIDPDIDVLEVGEIEIDPETEIEGV